MRLSMRAGLTAVAMLLVASGAWALGQARMYGLVVNQAGEKVAGAKIVVTCPGLANFKEEFVSDDKGKYKLALVDATKTYHFQIQAEGFAVYDQDVKIPISSNTEKNFTLVAAQAATTSVPVADPGIDAFNAGVGLLNGGDSAGALAKFDEATKLRPDLATAWGAMAMIYLQDKKYELAAEYADKAAALDPGDTRALKIAVEAYHALGDKADKAKSAAASAALAAADPEAGAVDLYNQGVQLYNEGKTADAIPLLEQALAADPNYARAHYILGICYAGSNGAKAKDHFQKFLAAAPDDPDAATAKEMLGYL